MQLACQPNLTTLPLSTKTDENKNNNSYSGNMEDADFKGNIKHLSYKTLNTKHTNSQHYHNKHGETPSPKFTNSSRHDSTYPHQLKKVQSTHPIWFLFEPYTKPRLDPQRVRENPSQPPQHKSHKPHILVLKKPLQWDILIGSIRQCSANRDWKYSYF
jgi:hypothetical protein